MLCFVSFCELFFSPTHFFSFFFQWCNISPVLDSRKGLCVWAFVFRKCLSLNADVTLWSMCSQSFSSPCRISDAWHYGCTYHRCLRYRCLRVVSLSDDDLISIDGVAMRLFDDHHTSVSHENTIFIKSR